MDEAAFQSKLQEIGAFILGHEEYVAGDWDTISVVVTLSEGSRKSNGYIYRGDFWEARVPAGIAFKDLCEELQEITKSPSGETWKQALIHVTQPGPEINVKFEYDDPKRWSLKKVSLDLEDYAMSLHPNAA